MEKWGGLFNRYACEVKVEIKKMNEDGQANLTILSKQGSARGKSDCVVKVTKSILADVTCEE